jgi:hypothetical protein
MSISISSFPSQSRLRAHILRFCKLYMKTLVSIIALLVTTTSYGETYRDPVWGFPGFADGKRFDFTIRSRDLFTTSEWRSDQEHPALSPRKAEKLAISKLRTLVKNPEEWSREEIILQDSKFRNRWFYIISFAGRVEADKSIPRMIVVVLMDGTTPEPKVADLAKSDKNAEAAPRNR